MPIDLFMRLFYPGKNKKTCWQGNDFPPGDLRLALMGKAGPSNNWTGVLLIRCVFY